MASSFSLVPSLDILRRNGVDVVQAEENDEDKERDEGNGGGPGGKKRKPVPDAEEEVSQLPKSNALAGPADRVASPEIGAEQVEAEAALTPLFTTREIQPPGMAIEVAPLVMPDPAQPIQPTAAIVTADTIMPDDLLPVLPLGQEVDLVIPDQFPVTIDQVPKIDESFSSVPIFHTDNEALQIKLTANDNRHDMPLPEVNVLPPAVGNVSMDLPQGKINFTRPAVSMDNAIISEAAEFSITEAHIKTEDNKPVVTALAHDIGQPVSLPQKLSVPGMPEASVQNIRLQPISAEAKINQTPILTAAIFNGVNTERSRTKNALPAREAKTITTQDKTMTKDVPARQVVYTAPVQTQKTAIKSVGITPVVMMAIPSAQTVKLSDAKPKVPDIIPAKAEPAQIAIASAKPKEIKTEQITVEPSQPVSSETAIVPVLQNAAAAPLREEISSPQLIGSVAHKEEIVIDKEEIVIEKTIEKPLAAEVTTAFQENHSSPIPGAEAKFTANIEEICGCGCGQPLGSHHVSKNIDAPEF